MARVFTLALLIGASLFSHLAPAHGEPEELSHASTSGSVVTFVHVNVITMERDEILRDMTVVVTDGRISSLHASSPTERPVGTCINGAGKYLIPGLVDSHIHLESKAIIEWAYHQDVDVDYSKTLLPYIYNGVTTAIVMSGEPDLLKLRDRIARGEIAGPRLFVSALVDGKPRVAIGPQVYSLSDGSQGAQLARQLHADGYDQLKVYSALTRESYQALVDEAKTLHWPVAGQ